ncbi:MAG: hypothetical protein FK734_21290 [Asgard group archaeon]|nr:hypothetical protein [Asgard group archaeon]
MSNKETLQVCFNCQTENEPEEDYCTNCGVKLRHKIRKNLKAKKESVKVSKATLSFILVIIIIAIPILTIYIRSTIYNGIVKINSWSVNDENNEITIVFRCFNGSSILKYVAIAAQYGIILSEVKYNLKMDSTHTITVTLFFSPLITDDFTIHYDCYTYGPSLQECSL